MEVNGNICFYLLDPGIFWKLLLDAGRLIGHHGLGAGAVGHHVFRAGAVRHLGLAPVAAWIFHSGKSGS